MVSSLGPEGGNWPGDQKISCGDDGGGGDGLDLPPVRRHAECDLDLSARLSGNQDGLTYYEI